MRALWNDFVAIKRILDADTQGVLVPYVNTREEAEMAVKACKYPLDGIRGVAGSSRAAGYGQNIGNYLHSYHDQIFVMIAVETPEAIANLDEILQVPGLDGIFIGPIDLASSMGFFCDPAQPAVQAEIRKIEEKVLAAGKVLATTTGAWEQAQTLFERGYQMLMLMADGGILAAIAAQKIRQFREAHPHG